MNKHDNNKAYSGVKFLSALKGEVSFQPVMAYIDELVSQISDEELREKLSEEVKGLGQNKKPENKLPPRMIIDASRSWPDMTQSRETKTIIRTVLGMPDLVWALKVAVHSSPDCEIELLYDNGFGDCDGVRDNCFFWRSCAEQVAHWQLIGHKINVRYVGQDDENCCLNAHIAAFHARAGRPVEPELRVLVEKYK